MWKQINQVMRYEDKSRKVVRASRQKTTFAALPELHEHHVSSTTSILKSRYILKTRCVLRLKEQTLSAVNCFVTEKGKAAVFFRLIQLVIANIFCFTCV